MIIQSATFVTSSARPDQCPTDALPEYAFIGRSNVGKSSLINMLTGQRKLAMTSATPGKTLLINHFRVNNEWFLVDLPGYGYAKRGKQEKARLYDLINSYIKKREQLTNLFVLIDVRLSPQPIDLDFIEWLGQEGVPFSIVFTKADKLKPRALQTNVRAYLDHLHEQWDPLPPHFVTSSESKLGRLEVLAYIDQINRRLKQPANP